MLLRTFLLDMVLIGKITLLRKNLTERSLSAYGSQWYWRFVMLKCTLFFHICVVSPTLLLGSFKFTGNLGSQTSFFNVKYVFSEGKVFWVTTLGLAQTVSVDFLESWTIRSETLFVVLLKYNRWNHKLCTAHRDRISKIEFFPKCKEFRKNPFFEFFSITFWSKFVRPKVKMTHTTIADRMERVLGPKSYKLAFSIFWVPRFPYLPLKRSEKNQLFN